MALDCTCQVDSLCMKIFEFLTVVCERLSLFTGIEGFFSDAVKVPSMFSMDLH